MRVEFVTFGKFKSQQLEEVFHRYLEMASRYYPVKNQVLKQSSPLDLNLEKFTSALKGKNHLTILDETGIVKRSKDFSAFVQKKIIDQSTQNWVIVCGAEHGFSADFLKNADYLWSLSPLTMPHELAAAVAAEQVFRCFTILKGHPYHYQ